MIWKTALRFKASLIAMQFEQRSKRKTIECFAP